MHSEIAAVRVEALKGKGMETFSKVDVEVGRYERRTVQAHGRAVKVCILEEFPWAIGIAIKNQYDSDGEGGKLLVVMSKDQAEELARSIPGIDPPVEQQILEELGRIRAAIPSLEKGRDP